MRIRIFSNRPQDKDLGLEKYINFLRLEIGNGKPWAIEHCDPMKWSPSPGDIHIHVDTPVRLAVPWAFFNALILPAEDEWKLDDSWKWTCCLGPGDARTGLGPGGARTSDNKEKTKKEIGMVVPAEAFLDRKQALPTLRRIFQNAVKHQRRALPVEPPHGSVPPKVGIITVTRNRKDWWANMVQNVMKQKWPLSRLEWIIVDDGDEGQRLGEEVDTFMEKSPGIVVRYVEIATPKSIGFKRNAAVEAAGSDVSIFVCMDDDDHYPPMSVGRRVLWLRDTIQIAYCSVLPMYDLVRYISAVNVPELELGPSERVSEATLAFTREAWTTRPFPDVSMAEGLGFLEEREASSVEIPPTDVIVSFIHTKNSSSRRIPAEQEPNGCHYGFSDEYFKYLHIIGGDKQE